MSPNKPQSQTPKYTLSLLSSAVSVCCLALVSAVAQAASCDYLPDQPADTQISQCQSAAEAAEGEARSEIAKAAFDAGFLLETSKSEPNIELSARYYHIAADLGSPGAQYNLANQIVRSGGDMSEAAKYYRMAAKQGAKMAQYNLATQYLTGQGVTKDPQKAYLWFRTAAGLGLAAAQFELASLFEQGLGVEKNIPSAIGWYELAAQQGYVPAQKHLSDLKKNLTFEPESPKGLFGGLLIPRTPRQTLSFDPSDYYLSEFESEVAAQTSDLEADDADSSVLASEDGAAGFFSGLIKPKSKTNSRQFVYEDPQTPAQTTDVVASNTDLPVERVEAAVPDLIVLEESPTGAIEPSDSLASAATSAEPAELETEAPIQSEATAEVELVVQADLNEEQTSEIADSEVENTLTEEPVVAYIDVTQEALPEAVTAQTDPDLTTPKEPSAETPQPSETLASAPAAPEADSFAAEALTHPEVTEAAQLVEPAELSKEQVSETAEASSENLSTEEPLAEAAMVAKEAAPDLPPEQAANQSESASSTPISVEYPIEQDLSAEENFIDEQPAELPAAEVLTSALPAADLPEPAKSSTEAQSNQALVNLDSAGSVLAQSTNPQTLSANQQVQAVATPMAIEAAPEQLLAANAQSPEELEKILQDLPTYQVKRPEFPAEKAYLRAAESGSEIAQLALANAYAQGKGVPADSETAAKWYLRAARQGNADASLNLALSYKLGNGLKKNNEQALKWFKHSAFRGNAQALYNLGAMHASGIGTDIDETLAARYFSQSANLGYEPAKNALLFLNR